MLLTEPRIPRGGRVLVTGANGYIASHIVDILLAEGYKIRGTVRSERPWLQGYFDKKYGTDHFETCVITSLSDSNAFETALQDVAGVVHVASDVSGASDPKVVIPQIVAGTLSVLNAAARSPSVKSLVLTSSSTAVVLPKPDVTDIVIDENTWNDTAVEGAWSGETPPELMPTMVYAASKTQAEREFWRWSKANSPNFAVNSILPYLNFGKMLLPEIGGNTMAYLLKLLEGDATAIIYFPPEWFVDVRDTARLHVAALLDPTVESKRLFAFAEPFNWGDVLKILKKLRPEAPLPETPQNEGRDLFDFARVSKESEDLMRNVFGCGWTSLEESITDALDEN